MSSRSFLSQVVEKVALSQLTEHVKKNNVHERGNQSAYRQNHSTQSELLHLTGCLRESSNQGRVFILSLLDLSAVFDTVDHDILLDTLQTTRRLSRSALQWLSIYTTNIFQTILVKWYFAPSPPPTRLNIEVHKRSMLRSVAFSVPRTRTLTRSNRILLSTDEILVPNLF